LPPGTGDNTYLYALNEVFVPLAEEFNPQVIIANGGSDPHFADTLANLALTAKGFFKLAQIVRNTADRVCDGKLVLMPGSGYNPEILPLCWYALVAGAAGLFKVNVEENHPAPVEPSHCRGTVEKTIDELKRLLRNKWACFGGFTISGVQ
jgi:acetoin utilization deacetylase AcuC-like enzyme